MITSTLMWLRFAGIVLVIAVLYLGRAVLVPLALAVLLAFVLTPVVVALQRYLGRVAAVVVVVVLTFSFLGAVVWTLGGQLGAAHELPRYRDTIRQRIVDLRGASRGGAVKKSRRQSRTSRRRSRGRPRNRLSPPGKTRRPICGTSPQPSVPWSTPWPRRVSWSCSLSSCCSSARNSGIE